MTALDDLLTEAVLVELRPGAHLLVVPRETSLTPNQAREAQDYLQTLMPDDRKVIVIPFPADVMALDVTVDRTLSDGSAYRRVRDFFEAWDAQPPRPRAPGEPEGIAGSPGAAGSYFELLEADLRELLADYEIMRKES